MNKTSLFIIIFLQITCYDIPAYGMYQIIKSGTEALTTPLANLISAGQKKASPIEHIPKKLKSRTEKFISTYNKLSTIVNDETNDDFDHDAIDIALYVSKMLTIVNSENKNHVEILSKLNALFNDPQVTKKELSLTLKNLQNPEISQGDYPKPGENTNKEINVILLSKLEYLVFQNINQTGLISEKLSNTDQEKKEVDQAYTNDYKNSVIMTLNEIAKIIPTTSTYRRASIERIRKLIETNTKESWQECITEFENILLLSKPKSEPDTLLLNSAIGLQELAQEGIIIPEENCTARIVNAIMNNTLMEDDFKVYILQLLWWKHAKEFFCDKNKTTQEITLRKETIAITQELFKLSRTIKNTALPSIRHNANSNPYIVFYNQEQNNPLLEKHIDNNKLSPFKKLFISLKKITDNPTFEYKKPVIKEIKPSDRSKTAIAQLIGQNKHFPLTENSLANPALPDSFKTSLTKYLEQQKKHNKTISQKKIRQKTIINALKNRSDYLTNLLNNPHNRNATITSLGKNIAYPYLDNSENVVYSLSSPNNHHFPAMGTIECDPKKTTYTVKFLGDQNESIITKYVCTEKKTLNKKYKDAICEVLSRKPADVSVRRDNKENIKEQATPTQQDNTNTIYTTYREHFTKEINEHIKNIKEKIAKLELELTPEPEKQQNLKQPEPSPKPTPEPEKCSSSSSSSEEEELKQPLIHNSNKEKQKKIIDLTVNKTSSLLNKLLEKRDLRAQSCSNNDDPELLKIEDDIVILATSIEALKKELNLEIIIKPSTELINIFKNINADSSDYDIETKKSALYFLLLSDHYEFLTESCELTDEVNYIKDVLEYIPELKDNDDIILHTDFSHATKNYFLLEKHKYPHLAELDEAFYTHGSFYLEETFDLAIISQCESDTIFIDNIKNWSKPDPKWQWMGRNEEVKERMQITFNGQSDHFKNLANKKKLEESRKKQPLIEENSKKTPESTPTPKKPAKALGSNWTMLTLNRKNISTTFNAQIHRAINILKDPVDHEYFLALSNVVLDDNIIPKEFEDEIKEAINGCLEKSKQKWAHKKKDPKTDPMLIKKIEDKYPNLKENSLANPLPDQNSNQGPEINHESDKGYNNYFYIAGITATLSAIAIIALVNHFTLLDHLTMPSFNSMINKLSSLFKHHSLQA